MKKRLKITLILLTIFILIALIFLGIGYLVGSKKVTIGKEQNYIESQEQNVTHGSEGVATNIINNTYVMPEEEYEKKLAKRSIDNVKMELKEGTLTRKGATFIITDKNEISYSYGTWYRIDIKKNGEWKEVTPIVSEITWNAIAMIIKNVKAEEKVDWSKIYGALKKGEYRLVKEVDNTEIYAEFTIE